MPMPASLSAQQFVVAGHHIACVVVGFNEAGKVVDTTTISRQLTDLTGGPISVRARRAARHQANRHDGRAPEEYDGA